MRMLIPVGLSGWAIAAGYLGLVGFVIFPLAPFAIVAAALGRREIASNPLKHGKGRVAVGFIGGAIGLVVMVLFLASKL